MKFILSAIALLFAGMCFAQEGQTPPEQKFPKTPLGIIPPFGLQKNKVVPVDQTMLAELKRSDLLKSREMLPPSQYPGTLPNGNTVIVLPQDNMPCIIPNENAIASMPNVNGMPTIPYRYKGPGAIPNPAKPIDIQKTKKKQ